MNQDHVIICGAGPVGLICGLTLAKAGVPVTIFERGNQLFDDPRAATTHPATLEVLASVGLEEEIRAAGLVAPIFQFWDRVSGELVAEFDHGLLEDETDFPYVVQCEQFKTARIALVHLQTYDNVQIFFGHEVIAVEQDGSRVTARVRHEGGEIEVGASWLIGADGGRSVVRKSAGIAFEGFTFPERFIVFTTPFDFLTHRGYSYRSYFADPDEWCNCFKVAADGPPGLWRTVFPADSEATEEDLMSDDAVQARLQKFFPTDGDYEVVHRNIYSVHQRVAATFRADRILLAGDAAHINNPIGGMGLNGGIQDAVNLGRKLARVIKGEAEDTLLDLYDMQRRTISTEFVQAQSIANKKQLEARDAAQRQENLRNLRETAADPVRAKAFLMRSSMLEALRSADRLEHN